MTLSISRRRFIQLTSSAAAVGALSSVAGRAGAQASGELTVALNGGDYAKACVEAYVKPFQAETGINVNAVAEEVTNSQLELMVTTNNVSLDVIPLSPSVEAIATARDQLEEIDYSIYKQDELDAILDFTKTKYSVGSILYAWCLVYNTDKYPADKPRPASWSEFWDVDKYPGVRTLVSGQTGHQGPWEEALLADGVPADAIYPMDIDRVFASLDKIKPHIRKWWANGSEIQQMMRDNAVDLAQSYDGRATVLADEGLPIEINHSQQKVTWESWGIPKGSRNLENAQKFIEFITRADRQAAFAQLMPYGPANQNAFKLIPDELGRKFASHPDYVTTSIMRDANWYAAVGAAGLTNAEILVQRWNEWILR